MMWLKPHARLHFKANAVPIWVFRRCQISLGSRFNSCHKESTVFNLFTKDLEPHGNDGGDMDMKWTQH